MPKKEEMEIKGGEKDKPRDVKNGNTESEMEEGPFIDTIGQEIIT